MAFDLAESCTRRLAARDSGYFALPLQGFDRPEDTNALHEALADLAIRCLPVVRQAFVADLVERRVGLGRPPRAPQGEARLGLRGNRLRGREEAEQREDEESPSRLATIRTVGGAMGCRRPACTVHGILR